MVHGKVSHCVYTKIRVSAQVGLECENQVPLSTLHSRCTVGMSKQSNAAALWQCIRNDNLDKFKQLCVNINMRNVLEGGDSGLMLAAQFGSIKVAMYILALDPHIVNHQDCNGRTALHVALASDASSKLEMIKLLVQHNANALLVDRKNEMNCLEYAKHLHLNIHAIQILETSIMYNPQSALILKLQHQVAMLQQFTQFYVDTRKKEATRNFSSIQWGKVLGKGAYGEVYEVQVTMPNESAPIVAACKKLSDCTEFDKEQANVMSNYCPYVVALLGTYGTDCLIYEKADKSLFKVLEEARESSTVVFPIATKNKWALHIGRGLYMIHCIANMVHCDIKPGNVLLFGDTAKICDLGLTAKAISSRISKSVYGTLAYMAPEMLKPSSTAHYGKPVDIYAFGLLLFEMYTCLILPSANAQQDDLHKAMLQAQAPSFMQHIVLRCTKSDPKERIAIEELVMLLEMVQ